MKPNIHATLQPLLAGFASCLNELQSQVIAQQPNRRTKAKSIQQSVLIVLCWLKFG